RLLEEVLLLVRNQVELRCQIIRKIVLSIKNIKMS
ncbi:hypothetical protein NT03LS_0181a, partial [Listeria seeligeri FSL N1-067]